MVTVEVTTEHHSRPGIATAYQARRCADFPAALAFARSHWQRNARRGVRARFVYTGDGGHVMRRAELHCS